MKRDDRGVYLARPPRGNSALLLGSDSVPAVGHGGSSTPVSGGGQGVKRERTKELGGICPRPGRGVSGSREFPRNGSPDSVTVVRVTGVCLVLTTVTEQSARTPSWPERLRRVLCHENDDGDGEVSSQNVKARIIMSGSHSHKLLLHKLSASFEELLNCTQHNVCLCVMDGSFFTSFIQKQF